MAPVLPKTSMIELEARAILSKLTESCTVKEFLMDIQLPKKSIAGCNWESNSLPHSPKLDQTGAHSAA